MTDKTDTPKNALNAIGAAVVMAGPGAMLRAYVIVTLLSWFTTFRLGVVQVMGLGLILSLATLKISINMYVSRVSAGMWSPWKVASTSIAASLFALGYGYLISLFL